MPADQFVVGFLSSMRRRTADRTGQHVLVSSPELHLGQQREHDNRPNSFWFLVQNCIQDSRKNMTTGPIVISSLLAIIFRTTGGTGQHVQQLLASGPGLHLGQQKEQDNRGNSYLFLVQNCIYDTRRNGTTGPIVVSFLMRIVFRTTAGTGQQAQQLLVSCSQLLLRQQKEHDNRSTSCCLTTDGAGQQAQQFLVSGPDLHLGQQQDHDNRPKSCQFPVQNCIKDSSRNMTTCAVVNSFTRIISFRIT